MFTLCLMTKAHAHYINFVECGTRKLDDFFKVAIPLQRKSSRHNMNNTAIPNSSFTRVSWLPRNLLKYSSWRYLVHTDEYLKLLLVSYFDWRMHMLLHSGWQNALFKRVRWSKIKKLEIMINQCMFRVDIVNDTPDNQINYQFLLQCSLRLLPPSREQIW